ncbi:hypothetical protein AB1K83_13830 [Sporosarcina sp. 179-K 3D1 HS]|uniref:hypothetical protein n=1 Tax=Sporosarcina sp. 179-K 3D1 HS TaxID=3232169 RepID=UPI0039A1F88B
MSKEKRDDAEIEKLLGSMPDIRDTRSKSEILDRLRKDERLQRPEGSLPTRRKSPVKWMPALVTVAAILVLSLLLPSMLQNNDGAMSDEAAESQNMEIKTFGDGSQDDTMDASSFKRSGEVEESAAYSLGTAATSYVVLADELAGYHPFRIGLTYAADVIPVTFLIPEERVSEDFPGGDRDSVRLYNRYASEIPEEELGFDDYHPYIGGIIDAGDDINHQVPPDHGYDMSSATLEVYTNTVLETFTDHLRLKTIDEKGNLVTFDQVGTKEPIPLTAGKRPLPYYKYSLPSGKTYLVPSGGIPIENVESALQAMKEAPNDLVDAIVPENVDYDVEVTKGTVTISFKEPLDLEGMSPDAANELIEGFMLTANNYDMVVKLEHTVQDYFSKYDLTTVLPEPVGVNPMPFPE